MDKYVKDFKVGRKVGFYSNKYGISREKGRKIGKEGERERGREIKEGSKQARKEACYSSSEHVIPSLRKWILEDPPPRDCLPASLAISVCFRLSERP